MPDAPLMQLVEHFPSVKNAVSLYVGYFYGLPTDAALDKFKRLETIVIDIDFDETIAPFWSTLFGTTTFRRVSNFILTNYCAEFPEVDDGEIFDFITDFLLIPAGKPRLVSIEPTGKGSLDALERRFCESK